MAYFRRSGSQIALFVVALLGVVISIYLTIVHYSTDVPLVCSDSGLVNCERVLTSPYSYVPGTTLPVALPGILWSVVAALLAVGAWLIWPRMRLVRVAEMIWASVGIVTVLYLVYVEIVFLRTICAWCTAVHVLVLLYFLGSLIILQSSGDDEGDGIEVEEPSVLTSHSH
jgi:uncharacterized membrane protein